jgi:hypothetical protein
MNENPLWPAGHLPHKGGENLAQTAQFQHATVRLG